MDIAGKIRGFIRQNFYAAASAGLEDNASLLDAGVVDSTGILEVVTFLEAEFGIKVHDTELLPENLDSVENIAQYFL